MLKKNKEPMIETIPAKRIYWCDGCGVRSDKNPEAFTDAVTIESKFIFYSSIPVPRHFCSRCGQKVDRAIEIELANLKKEN